MTKMIKCIYCSGRGEVRGPEIIRCEKVFFFGRDGIGSGYAIKEIGGLFVTIVDVENNCLTVTNHWEHAGRIIKMVRERVIRMGMKEYLKRYPYGKKLGK